ncbi:MAG TPA: DDE-type integrase/transposase/recombinase [Nevskia sp.]|nr:DDE-type integrase/transposase/recombinase [Nevskia sp.]
MAAEWLVPPVVGATALPATVGARPLLECGEQDHLWRLGRIFDVKQHRQGRQPPRRGWPAQRRERELEQMVRRQCVQFRITAAEQGLSRDEAADFLGLLPRTLRYWEQRYGADGLQPVALGRPVARSPVAQRNEVVTAIRDIGPGVGVPTLRTHFPLMTRAELADLLIRSRRVYRSRYRQNLRVLHWLRPGSVWAIDFSEAPSAIDGVYPYLLAVRDLASHYTLLWLPVTEMTAEVTVNALKSLVAKQGAPLLLKADNGPSFHAEATTSFLAAMQVQILFSPAYTPRYNGAIEAGIGALKTRTHHQAALHGNAGNWTCDDVEAAREEANTLVYPFGENGPTPDASWQDRQRVTVEERRRFDETLTEKMAEMDREQTSATEGDDSSMTKAKRQREAISRALVAEGYLKYTTRRIPSPISRPKVA